MKFRGNEERCPICGCGDPPGYTGPLAGMHGCMGASTRWAKELVERAREIETQLGITRTPAKQPQHLDVRAWIGELVPRVRELEARIAAPVGDVHG